MHQTFIDLDQVEDFLVENLALSPYHLGKRSRLGMEVLDAHKRLPVGSGTDARDSMGAQQVVDLIARGFVWIGHFLEKWSPGSGRRRWVSAMLRSVCAGRGGGGEDRSDVGYQLRVFGGCWRSCLGEQGEELCVETSLDFRSYEARIGVGWTRVERRVSKGGGANTLYPAAKDAYVSR